MNKDFLIELTKNLYRLTLLFPKKEPLRYKIMEVADDILADSPRMAENSKTVKNCSRPIWEELEVLDSFFEVAKTQNWVSPENLLAIQKEYANLIGELKKLKPEGKREEVKENSVVKTQPQQFSSQMMLERQEKILAFLREKGKTQVWQVKQIFPEVSKRTLRRDFEFLLKQGKIERIGERNATFYQLIRRTEV